MLIDEISKSMQMRKKIDLILFDLGFFNCIIMAYKEYSELETFLMNT